MNKKSYRSIVWKSVLCGFLYELFYEIALALRWMTLDETYSFIAAALSGIAIALIIRQSKAVKTFIATMGGLASAFIFLTIVVRLDIPLKILLYIDPQLREVGHYTVNENITRLFVSVGYLFISLVTYLLTLGVLAVICEHKNQQGTRI